MPSAWQVQCGRCSVAGAVWQVQDSSLRRRYPTDLQSARWGDLRFRYMPRRPLICGDGRLGTPESRVAHASANRCK